MFPDDERDGLADLADLSEHVLTLSRMIRAQSALLLRLSRQLDTVSHAVGLHTQAMSRLLREAEENPR